MPKYLANMSMNNGTDDLVTKYVANISLPTICLEKHRMNAKMYDVASQFLLNLAGLSLAPEIPYTCARNPYHHARMHRCTRIARCV